MKTVVSNGHLHVIDDLYLSDAHALVSWQALKQTKIMISLSNKLQIILFLIEIGWKSSGYNAADS